MRDHELDIWAAAKQALLVEGVAVSLMLALGIVWWGLL